MRGLREEVNRLQLLEGVTPLGRQQSLEITGLGGDITAEIGQEFRWCLQNRVHHGPIQAPAWRVKHQGPTGLQLSPEQSSHVTGHESGAVIQSIPGGIATGLVNRIGVDFDPEDLYAAPGEGKAYRSDSAVSINDPSLGAVADQPVADAIHNALGLRRIDLKKGGGGQFKREFAEPFRDG